MKYPCFGVIVALSKEEKEIEPVGLCSVVRHFEVRLALGQYHVDVELVTAVWG